MFSFGFLGSLEWVSIPASFSHRVLASRDKAIVLLDPRYKKPIACTFLSFGALQRATRLPRLLVVNRASAGRLPGARPA
jgi:hypothetical protein